MWESSRHRITHQTHKVSDSSSYDRSICHVGPWRAFFPFLFFSPFRTVPRRCQVRPHGSPARASDAWVNQVNDARWCRQRVCMGNNSGVNMWTATWNDKHGHEPGEKVGGKKHSEKTSQSVRNGPIFNKKLHTRAQLRPIPSRSPFQTFLRLLHPKDNMSILGKE